MKISRCISALFPKNMAFKAVLSLFIMTLAPWALAASHGFLPNSGRLDQPVQYYGTSAQVDVFFTRNSVVFDIKDPQSLVELREILASEDDSLPLPTRRGQSLHLSFSNANAHAELIASDSNPARHNFFFGNDSRTWSSNQSSYRTLTYRNLWDGVDVVFTLEQGNLSYEIIGDASAAQMQWLGADEIRATNQGTELTTTYGSLMDNGSRIGHLNNDQNDDLIFSNRGVNALLWSTMIGGSGDDEGASLAIASNGDIIITGETNSPNYPGTPGAYEENASNYLDVFVSRFSDEGATLQWSTYIGTSNNDYVNAMVLDGSDNPIIGGRSASNSYPTTVGAYDESCNGGTSDATLTKLSSDGTSLIFSTFVGGSDVDSFFDLAVDASGNLVCAGYTASSNYPTSVGAFQTSFQGPPYDFTVSIISADGSTLNAGTYVGGTDRDACRGVAVDGNGDIFLSGFSFSGDFPVSAGAFQTVKGTIDDAALVKITSDLTTILWATFLGGNGSERALCIDLDSADNPIIAGFTYSTDFPTTAGTLQETYNSSMESFVTKFDNATGARTWATYMGGPHVDEIVSLVVDADDNPVVTGWTTSPSFPVNSLGYDDTHNGDEDIFVSRLNPTGTDLLWGTFLGGSASDRGMEVIIDADDNPVVTGRTASSGFPVSSWAYDDSHNGGDDAFLARFDTGDANLSLAAQSSNVGCGTSTDITFTFTPDLPHTPPLRGYSVRILAPIGLTFSPGDISVLSPLVGVNDTFQIIENAPGDCTIDFSFLDLGAGLDVSADLFTIAIFGNSEGLATLGVNSAQFRDADNHPFDVDIQNSLDFNVDCTAADIPTLNPEPIYTQGTSNTVSWSDESASGAVSYKVQASNLEDFSTISLESLFVAGQSYEFTGLNSATKYYFRVISRDENGQDSAASGSISSTQDADLPVSSVTAMPGSFGATFDVAYLAGDVGSGLENVELFYNFEGGIFASSGVFTSTPVSFTGTDGDGVYGFYTVARDSVGNIESTPGVADATALIDTSAPDAPSISAEPLFTAGGTNTITCSDESASGAVVYNFQMSQLVDFSVIDSESGNIAGLSHEFTGLTDATLYYFRVFATDNQSNASDFSAIASSTQDASAPVSSASAVTDQGAVAFDIAFISNDAGIGTETVELFANFDGGPFTSQGTSGISPISFTAASGQGTYGFFTVAVDSLGNTEINPGSLQSSCVLDLTAPESSVSALAEYQNNGVFNITATGTDNLVGIETYELFYSLDAGPWTSAGPAGDGVFSFVAPADGQYGFYSIATDSVGHTETAPGVADANTNVDTDGPTGSFAINAGASATNLVAVTLNQTISGAMEMRYSNDNITFSEGWIAFAASHSWTLDNTHGTRTVYGEFRDPAGNLLQTTDTIELDITPTAAVTFLEVNPAHEAIKLTWHNPDDADLDHVEIWRALLQDTVMDNPYPDYTSLVIPTAPNNRAAALASSEWVLDGSIGEGAEAYIDTTIDRGVYYYEVFAVDTAGNFSAPSALMPRATNYILGDIAPVYDGQVDVNDLTVLGATYGLTDGESGFNRHADVGPTDDSNSAGIPQPDDYIGFEDLMITTGNYGLVSNAKQELQDETEKATGPVLLSWFQSGTNQFTLRLLSTDSGLKGLNISADLAPGTTINVTPGELLSNQSHPLFLQNVASHGLDAGCVLIGNGTYIEGDGDLLTVTLAEAPDLSVLDIENISFILRDANNQDLEFSFEMASAVEVPVRHAMGKNYPNPFNPMTTISFSLPQDEMVRLEVYGINGRLVATLVNESYVAGHHQVTWAGRDNSGHQVASGVYFYRINAGGFSDVQKMTLMK